MARERSSTWLLALLALLLAGALAAWLARSGGPGRGLDVPALARPPAPEEVISVGSPSVAAPEWPRGPGERVRARDSDAGLPVDPSAARSLPVSLELPPGVPPDEELALFTASFGPDQDAGAEAWLAQFDPAGSSIPRAPFELACRPGPHGGFTALVHPGAARAFVRIDARYLFLSGPVEVDLERDRRLTLRPELGAWVSGSFLPPAGESPEPFDVRLRTWSPLGHGVRLERRCALDDSHAFEFRGVRCDLDHTLMADPGSLAAVTLLSVDLQPGEHFEREFTLVRGARLAGRVLGPDDRPLAGALVRADTSGLPHIVRPVRATETDEAGRFELEAISPGTVNLYVDHPPLRSLADEPRPLADGEVVEVELRLAAGESVAGHVTWPDGSPAAGARVTLTEPSRPGLLSGGTDRRDHQQTTSSDGRFRFGGLGPGPFVVRARAAPVGAGLGAAAEGPTGVGDWNAERRDVHPSEQLALALRAPLAISGRVVDENLQGLAAYDLRVAELRGPGAGEGSFEPEHHRVTRPDGVFHLSGLAPGSWLLSAHAEGHAGPAVRRVELPAEVGPLLFELPRAARVQGTVIGPGGSPLAGAEVDFDVLDGPRPWHVRAATTDETGSFALAGLPPGAVVLEARGRGHAPAYPQRVDLTAGEQRAGLVLELRPAGRLTGEVYRPDGTPDTGRDVFVVASVDSLGESTRTDVRGRFEVGGLAAGEHLLVLHRDPTDGLPPLPPAPVHIVAGETVHVVLGVAAGREVVLRGSVTSGGLPVPGASLRAHRAGASVAAAPRSGSTAEDGSFALVLEDAGAHLLVVASRAHGAAEFELEIPRASEHRVALTLPTGRLVGTVRDPAGAPVAGASVAWTSDDGRAPHAPDARVASTDAEGRFELGGLAPGGYTLRAHDPVLGYALAPGLAVGDGGEVRVELELGRGGSLVGTVRDELGRPVAGAAVHARDARGAWLETAGHHRTGTDGVFELAGCPPGDYTVLARTADAASRASEPLPVSEGQATPLELLLEPGATLLVAVEGAPAGTGVLVVDGAGRDLTSLGARLELASPAYAPERSFGPLAPGDYTVRLVGTDPPVERRVPLAAGQTTRVVLAP